MRIIGNDDVIATSVSTVDNSYHSDYQSLSPDRYEMWSE